ncbi:LPXTG cell wall anchor domain-containing protein, partial [Clostridium sp.]|uniref:LPXTG cell wall anchor domain-containing protein n=1 Tax=Clostridium sp. TaxID=1506 RepID=UPI003F38A6A3
VTIANKYESITNLDKLVALESRLGELKEEKENQDKKVQAAIDAINALPKVEDLKLSDEQAVISARQLVTIANNNDKITNLDKLVALEAKLVELKNNNNNQQNQNKPNSNTNKPNNKPGNGKLPNTGGTAAAGVLSLGTILLGAGGYISKKRK